MICGTFFPVAGGFVHPGVRLPGCLCPDFFPPRAQAFQFFSTSSSDDQSYHGQHCHTVHTRDNIIYHDTPATRNSLCLSSRKRFHDIERAKQQEAAQQPFPRGMGNQQNVNIWPTTSSIDHLPGVRAAKILLRFPRCPNARRQKAPTKQRPEQLWQQSRAAASGPNATTTATPTREPAVPGAMGK